ncbi:hypothetical protein OBBRIDRAFT_690027, partial [Obba rivulosa]
TTREELLIAALQEAEGRNEARKQQVVGLQATVVLQGMYVGRAHEQLQAQEDKAAQKRKNRVFGDGMAKLLTGNQFFEAVEELERKTTEEARKRAHAKAARLAHSTALVEWKKEDEARLKRNREKVAAYTAAVREWE